MTIVVMGEGNEHAKIGPEEVREALTELQLYLSDRVPPLMVADSMALLLALPPNLVAGEIQNWMASQFRGASAPVAASDYLFHALRKIHVLADFQLIPREILTAYLKELAVAVLPFCPEEDRELLKQNLSHVGQSEATASGSVTILHRPEGEALSAATTARVTHASTHVPAPAQLANPLLSQEVALGLRRFALLLERLEREPTLATAAPAREGELASQLVSTAAASSSNEHDLEQHLSRLRQLGMGGGTDEMFRVLGRSMPGWSVPGTGGGFGPSVLASSEIEAMERIISLSKDDPGESAKRYREMVLVAVEQFNEGSLARAVAILDGALRVAEHKAVHPAVVERMRRLGHEQLSPDRLRKLAESPDKRPLLRKILRFFTSLSPEGLLDDLRTEPKRDRRRLIVALLEAHGPPARVATLDRLQASLKVDEIEREDPYFLRNALYILRLIPRAPEAPLDLEVELLRQIARTSSPAFLVKEALNNLGRILEETKHEKAERVLIFLLRSFERMALKRENDYPPDDLKALLERTCSALCRFGTPVGWDAVLSHALSTQLELGEPSARLAELGTQDLTRGPGVIGRLLDAITADLPRSVIGVTGKKEERVVHLVTALSGTPLPEVKQVLKDVAARFPNKTLGQHASKVLSGFSSRPKPEPAAAVSLSGDVELFGLPTLLQNLSDLHMTGVLTLLDTQGRPVAALSFEGGTLKSCKVGRLRGKEAFYHLFEKPFPGTFGLVRRTNGADTGTTDEAFGELMPLILEAIRRYDEFRRAVAIVPDEASFAATDKEPSPLADEPDEALLNVLWSKVASGLTAALCEESVPVDPYRVRRLLEHWLHEGALQRRRS
jgi:hypothetical protein